MIGSNDILEVENLTHRFGGLLALDNVSLTVERGKVTGLIGPNGSGKTTMFNIISGFIRPTSGRVLHNGEDITGLSPHLMTAHGLARTFQTPQPFATLTVEQTIRLAGTASGQDTAGFDARAIAMEVGLGAKVGLYPRELTTADLHALELAKVLATGAEVILLDEVFAGLNASEINDIVALIRRVAEGGRSFLLIEHRMRAVMALCHRVHVLLYGRLACSGSPDEVTRDPEVISAYLGTEEVAHA